MGSRWGEEKSLNFVGPSCWQVYSLDSEETIWGFTDRLAQPSHVCVHVPYDSPILSTRRGQNPEPIANICTRPLIRTCGIHHATFGFDDEYLDDGVATTEMNDYDDSEERGRAGKQTVGWSWFI